MTLRVALASKNPGKVREIGSIIAPAGIELVAPADDWRVPAETESTYLGNALLKAHSLVEHMNLPCLADDSGIEVDLLDGEPGPRSARFAGEGATDDENLDKLIDIINSSPLRTARYRCVAVLVLPDGRWDQAVGTVEGYLLTERRGTGGFGYDPIFVPLDDPSHTMAEFTPQQKDAISHRGRAFRALIPVLRALVDE